MKMAIFGAGGNAKSVFDIIKNTNFILFDEKKKFLKIDHKKIKVNGTLKKIIKIKKKNSKEDVAIGNNNQRNNTV